MQAASSNHIATEKYNWDTSYNEEYHEWVLIGEPKKGDRIIGDDFIIFVDMGGNVQIMRGQ